MSQNKEVQPERKSKVRSLPLVFLFALSLALCGQASAAQPQSAFEQRTALKATSLLSPELLNSDLYTVDEEVINDGFLNHYTVRSRFGDFQANSTLAVKRVLHEIKAIAAMRRIQTKDTAVDSVVQSGKNTVDAVANLVTDPEKTLEGAAAGVNNLFNRTTQVVGKRKTTGAEDSKVEQFIGKSKSKGDIASKFGVSVYSENAVLQAELDRLAWADYLGGIGVGLAQSAIPGVGGLLLSTSGTARILNEVINNTPASELWVRNKNKLEAMRIDSDTVQLFLNNPSFSPALQTVLVEAMQNMNGVANRGLFVKISLQANTSQMARTMTEIATMLAGYHKNIEPLQSVAPFGRFLYGKTKKGIAVLAFPADHILWSYTVADAATWLLEPVQGQSKPTAQQLWIFGDFSKKAEVEFKKLGWELHANAQARLLPDNKQKP